MPRSSNTSPVPSNTGPEQAPESSVEQNDSNTPLQTTWSPPLWLVSGTDQKHAARTKSQRAPSFKLPIPPVPPAMRQAVLDRHNKKGDHHGVLASEQKQIRQFQTKVTDAERKIASFQDVVTELQKSREQARDDVRSVRQEEMEKEVGRRQKQVRAEFEEKTKQRKEAWKRKVETQCDSERKRLRQESEERRAQDEAKQAEPAVEATKGDGTGSDEKKASEESPKDELKSDLLRKEAEKLQEEADRLNNNRTEMIWLLKQVIKADQKRKAKPTGTEN